jgi:hypothetical protein
MGKCRHHLTANGTPVTIAAGGVAAWPAAEDARPSSCPTKEEALWTNNRSNDARDAGGAALALAALAGLALLLAWTAEGGAPDPAALAQEGATSTSTSTPRPPFTSPRGTPTFTRTPPPRPTPQPIKYITNPTEAYALGQRYYQGERPRGGEGAIPSGMPSASGEAAIQRSLFLPWSAPMAIGCGTKAQAKPMAIVPAPS